MNNLTLRGGAAALLLFCAGAASGTILDSITDDLYEISPTANVSVRNTDGRIYVYGSDAPELRVKAVRRAFTKERLEKIEVKVAINGESVVIETIAPPAPTGSILADRSATVDYTIVLPQTCTLSQVELGNGEVIVDGMRGKSVDARLGRGLMHITNCFSAARFTLTNGGLNVAFDWWEADAFSVSAEVKQGNLRVSLPVDAALHLQAATTSGQIINHVAADAHGGDPRKLETTIGGGSSCEFTLRTDSASIQIKKGY